MQKTDSFENSFTLGDIEGRRRRGRQRTRWLDCITDSVDMGLGGVQELVIYRGAVDGVVKSRTPLSDWTELNTIYLYTHTQNIEFLVLHSRCLSFTYFIYSSIRMLCIQGYIFFSFYSLSFCWEHTMTEWYYHSLGLSFNTVYIYLKGRNLLVSHHQVLTFCPMFIIAHCVSESRSSISNFPSVC